MNNITREQFDRKNIPLPPLPWQRRIVEKLEGLMAQCAALEESIRRSRERAEGLLREALAGPVEAGAA